MKTPFFALLAALAASAAPAADVPPAAGSDDLPAFVAAIHPALPQIPDARFDVRQFGARGDGSATETAAFQAAIDAARRAGGGTVEIPDGTYLCGPLELASHLRLQLARGAVLRMLPLEKYPGGTSHPDDLLGGANLHDIAITGAGTIDGQGAPWWPFAKTKGAKRPRMIALNACSRVLIEQVTLRDSPMFHIAIGGASSEVTVRGVTIRAPSSTDPVNPSHNTDACDVSGRNILVEDCDVSVGDDNFTCGSNTSNVLIRRCTYGSGHGLSIGSYTRGGVSNFAVLDCTFNGTECGIRIKSDRDRGGPVQNLFYQNLRMTGVNFPILIYGAYLAPERQFRDLTRLTAAIAATYPGRSVEPLTPHFRNIVFRHVTATAAPGRRAGLIWGLPEAPARNVVLDDVHITADRPFGLYCARDVRIVRSEIRTPAGVPAFDTFDVAPALAP
ncbi:glycoside hydrolase family 28 protein [Oleiharenicola sp. Vm1]|uniref:glycoside hydrolase family 28 protein n=1 Tax=Oleiharenicola sp. Vm1 TaxID=3398393 RepID=UPI0039F5CDF4